MTARSTLTTDAVISDCGRYRYVLRRIWNSDAAYLVFVMLNPSTADADVDDATVRKCMGFARRYGHGGIVIVNLFALRSRDPAALRSAPDPVGPDNDKWIALETSVLENPVIVAWGANARHFPERVRHVVGLIKRAVRALDITGEGHPGHPLMLSYAIGNGPRMPQPWSLAQ